MICSNCQREIAASSNFCYICGARQPAPAAQAPAPPKHLRRSSTDSKIGGVCAGFADYLDMDPTIVRLVWALLFFTPVPVVIGYIVAWIVIPQAPQPVPSPAPQPVHSPQAAT
jgi:phage shock protein C